MHLNQGCLKNQLIGCKWLYNYFDSLGNFLGPRTITECNMVRTIILRRSYRKNQDYLILNKSVFTNIFYNWRNNSWQCSSTVLIIWWGTVWSRWKNQWQNWPHVIVPREMFMSSFFLNVTDSLIAMWGSLC